MVELSLLLLLVALMAGALLKGFTRGVAVSSCKSIVALASAEGGGTDEATDPAGTAGGSGNTSNRGGEERYNQSTRVEICVAAVERRRGRSSGGGPTSR